MEQLKVTHFTRRPAPGAFSIERVFNDVRRALPPAIHVDLRENANFSRGILPRLKDALAARRHTQAVNHVVGDVHYLTYFLPRCRTVLTVHDTVLVDRERGLKRAILWFFWFWLPLRRSGWITAISEESRRRLADMGRIPASRIEVIPDPVSAEFNPKPLGPQDGAFRLLHIGTKPNKNLSRLLQALDGLDVELTVIGGLSDAQAAQVQTSVRRTRLLGRVDDDALLAEYARCELLCFVSLDEGFGLPIVEAQSTGRPVLTSARAPMDDVAGDAAILVDPEDTDAIRDGVCRIMGDAALRSDLIERGLRNAQRFSAQTIAALYADLYTRIAQGGANV